MFTSSLCQTPGRSSLVPSLSLLRAIILGMTFDPTRKSGGGPFWYVNDDRDVKGRHVFPFQQRYARKGRNVDAVLVLHIMGVVSKNRGLATLCLQIDEQNGRAKHYAADKLMLLLYDSNGQRQRHKNCGEYIQCTYIIYRYI